MISRRGILIGGAAVTSISGLSLAGCSPKVTQAVGFIQRMMEIQKRHGGRVGVSALTGTSTASSESNGALSIQSSDRFAMASTFKWVLAAAILQQVDHGKLKVAQLLKYSKTDLLDYSPVTTMHVAKGEMTIGDLCSATVSVSDNAAANLLLPLVGGPAGLTAFARSIGDQVTRFDRNEPTLNTNIEGDEQDTTTPEAMSGLLRKIYTGDVLKPESQKLLKDWMIATTTGKGRIPAGIPAGAVVAHKTGSGMNGAINDVGVIWLPNRPPVYMSIYTSGGSLDDAGRDKVIADITRLVFDTLAFVDTLDDKAESANSAGISS